MTTENQIQANQQNALLSTGAKTEEGKAVIAKNAVKHGLFTKELLIDSKRFKEDPTEYQTFLDNLMDCLHPQGQLESTLVEKIACDLWRLKRLLKYESSSILEFIESMYSGTRSHICPLPTTDETNLVIRYERSIEKAVFQKIVMLKNLQSARLS